MKRPFAAAEALIPNAPMPTVIAITIHPRRPSMKASCVQTQTFVYSQAMIMAFQSAVLRRWPKVGRGTGWSASPATRASLNQGVWTDNRVVMCILVRMEFIAVPYPFGIVGRLG